MIRSIVLASILLACGGSKPVPTSIEGGPQAGAPPAPTTTTAPETTRLAIGPLKVVLTDGAKRMEVSIAADGTVSSSSGGAKRDVRLTAYGELESEGKVVAKLADDGSLSVLEETIDKVEGKVVKSESTWTTVGVLAVDGSFTAAKDNRKLAIDHDGKVSGMPGNMEIVLEGAPAHRRAGMFLVIGMMAGGRRESDVKSAPTNQVVPVPPIQP